MKNSEQEDYYQFALPKEKIASRPAKPYDSAKLLHLNRQFGELTESTFKELGNFLRAGDILVFNNTKVNKARLLGTIKGKDKEAEFLILKETGEGAYNCIAKPVRNLPAGTVVEFRSGLTAEVIERVSDQVLNVKFSSANSETAQLLEQTGIMPIPPYIRGGVGDEQDEEDYQSMFAVNKGSIAAPTASLHFTPALLKDLKDGGVETEFITLHLGMASVRPLWDGPDSESVREPGIEYLVFDSQLIKRLNSKRTSGQRVIAVGTSVVRALETISIEQVRGLESGELIPTSLFIRPGFEFKAIDGLITNFHFPASSHLLLVQAMIGSRLLKKAYNYALFNNFRFLSYGDGMFIE